MYLPLMSHHSIFKPKAEMKKDHDISIKEIKKITNFSCKGTTQITLTSKITRESQAQDFLIIFSSEIFIIEH